MTFFYIITIKKVDGIVRDARYYLYVYGRIDHCIGNGLTEGIALYVHHIVYLF